MATDRVLIFDGTNGRGIAAQINEWLAAGRAILAFGGYSVSGATGLSERVLVYAVGKADAFEVYPGQGLRLEVSGA